MSSTEISVIQTNTTQSFSDLRSSTRPRNGYDIPVYGLKNGKFSYVHTTALACIAVSFIFSISILIVSFRTARKPFYHKTKSERLVVYMAVFDCLFNLFHSMDHLHILITKDHVRPPILCIFYAFMLGEFLSAQMLTVHIVAINVFCMIFLGMDLKFGKYDWKLISFTTSVPLILYIIAVVLGKLGPSGAFCYFDAVKGGDFFVYYNCVVVFYVVLANSLLYVATWIKIYKQSKTLSTTLGNTALRMKRLHNSARNMSLFVAVFFIQWTSLASYSVASLMGHIPDVILFFTIALTNVGGLLNGIAFLLIYRWKRKGKESRNTESTSSGINNDSNKQSCISQIELSIAPRVEDE